MDELVLELTDNKFYWPTKNSDNKIIHLAYWLSDDVGCWGIESWKNFVRDPNRNWTSSNYSSLEKEDNIITIGFEGDMMLDNPEVFITNAEELTYILDRWQEACEKKPKKITITRDNGKVTVDFEDY